MKNFKELLIELKACDEAIKWAGNKSWPEVYDQCKRGDWLLWLFKKTNQCDLRLLTLAKGKCAETIIHLMQDQRSKVAVKAAIDFGNGVINEDELTYASVYASAYATYAAASAYAYAASYAAGGDYARKQNELLTANIVREVIAIEKFNI